MKNGKSSPVGIIGTQYMRMNNFILIHRGHRKLLIKCYVLRVGAINIVNKSINIYIIEIYILIEIKINLKYVGWL